MLDTIVTIVMFVPNLVGTLAANLVALVTGIIKLDIPS